MKKTIIFSAIALCLSFVTVNANSVNSNLKNYELKEASVFFKVNSFCVSIAKGDLETVQKLISRGADVNAISNGMTPAMYAAKFNRTDILKLLIVHGADLKAKSNKGMTAKKYAEIHGAKDAELIIKEALVKSKKQK